MRITQFLLVLLMPLLAVAPGRQTTLAQYDQVATEAADDAAGEVTPRVKAVRSHSAGHPRRPAGAQLAGGDQEQQHDEDIVALAPPPPPLVGVHYFAGCAHDHPCLS